MQESFLIDTDVIIDFLRGSQEADKFMLGLKPPFYLSSITVAELFAGVQGKEEELVLEDFIYSFNILEVTKSIAVLGGLIRNKYGKSHGTGLADALIAATAKTHETTLITLNKKHFPMVDSIIIPYTK
ncbi:MAG: type II toxin-antitoxin system VapC family toxin [Balneolales bacterium]